MARDKKISSSFMKLSKEHILINDYILKLESFQDESAKLSKLKEILIDFQNDLKEHFELEDQFLFPTAMLCLPSLELFDTILLLQKEHGYFEMDIQTLIKCVNKQIEDKKTLPESMRTFLGDILRTMLKHTEKEMTYLFPKMDENKKARKVIKGYVFED